MIVSRLLMTKADRLLAKEEARYAHAAYAERAEERLRSKAIRSRSSRRRRIYRMAIRELRRFAGSDTSQ